MYQLAFGLKKYKFSRLSNENPLKGRIHQQSIGLVEWMEYHFKFINNNVFHLWVVIFRHVLCFWYVI